MTPLRKAMAFLALIWLALPGGVRADSYLPPSYWADRQLPDPEQERAARHLMDTIRCLVCAGQSVGDSDAEIAGDLRALIRQRIAAGETPEQIRTWLIGRYGRAISYDPPLDRATLILWLAPVLALGAGGLLASRRFRRKGR